MPREGHGPVGKREGDRGTLENERAKNRRLHWRQCLCRIAQRNEIWKKMYERKKFDYIRCMLRSVFFFCAVHFAPCGRLATDARLMYTRRTYLPTNSQQGSVPCLNIAHTSQLAIQPKGSQLAKPGIPWNTERTISNRKWHGNLPPTTKKKQKKTKRPEEMLHIFRVVSAVQMGNTEKKCIFRTRDRTHGKATHISPRPMLSMWHCVLSLFVLYEMYKSGGWSTAIQNERFLFSYTYFVDETSL